MNDYLRELDRRLFVIAGAQGAAAQRRRRLVMKRPAVLAGLSAVGAAIAGLALVDVSAAQLPILSTPAHDVSRLRPAAGIARTYGVDFTQGHGFATANGAGYVVASRDGRRLCLLAPEPAVSDGFGVACSASKDEAERRGLYVEFAQDGAVTRSPRTFVVFVMPQGAREVAVRVAGGSAREAVLESGVLVTSVSARAELTWSVDGRRFRRTVTAPFAGRFGSGVAYSCPDGRIVHLQAGGKLQPNTPAYSRALRREAIRRCAHP